MFSHGWSIWDDLPLTQAKGDGTELKFTNVELVTTSGKILPHPRMKGFTFSAVSGGRNECRRGEWPLLFGARASHGNSPEGA